MGRWRRWAACTSVGAALATLSCHSSDTLRSFQITGVVQADETCNFAATNSALTLGSFDPSVPGASSYQLGLLLQNNLGTTTDLVTTWTSTSAVEYHALQLEAVETCWYLANGNNVPSVRETNTGAYVDCQTLPGQSATLPASLLIPPPNNGQGGAAVVVLPIADLTQLRTVLGPSFTPEDIPSVGVYDSQNPAFNSNVAGVAQSNAEVLAYDFSPSTPGPVGKRSAAWGEKYPETLNAQIVYQFRAVAKTSSGGVLHSNWLSFPINVCPKCVQAMCGPLVQEICARGPCSDGTPCLQSGTCANTSLTCSAITLFSGTVPDWGTTSMCLPAQSFAGTTPPSCTAVGCAQ